VRYVRGDDGVFVSSDDNGLNALPSRLQSLKTGVECALCGTAKGLRQSHIIPAFVFKWLKETSATGFIRSGENPNLRVQDGYKIKLLCAECEQWFGKWETIFAAKIFYPYLSDPSCQVAYSHWYAKFCVSVSWRVLVYYMRRGLKTPLDATQQIAVERALETWEGFIKGSLRHPDKHEQHILPLASVASTTVPDLPNNINRYFQRAVEMDLVIGEKSGALMTYAKLGPLMLFGFVGPLDPKWVDTRIAVASGVFRPKDYIIPSNLLGFIKDRAQNYSSISNRMSLEQVEKVESLVLKNVDRVRASDQFKAMLDDYDMFGPSAVIRSSTK